MAAEFWEQGDLERTVLDQQPIVSVASRASAQGVVLAQRRQGTPVLKSWALTLGHVTRWGVGAGGLGSGGSSEVESGGNRQWIVARGSTGPGRSAVNTAGRSEAQEVPSGAVVAAGRVPSQGARCWSQGPHTAHGGAGPVGHSVVMTILQGNQGPGQRGRSHVGEMGRGFAHLVNSGLNTGLRRSWAGTGVREGALTTSNVSGTLGQFVHPGQTARALPGSLSPRRLQTMGNCEAGTDRRQLGGSGGCGQRGQRSKLTRGSRQGVWGPGLAPWTAPGQLEGPLSGVRGLVQHPGQRGGWAWFGTMTAPWTGGHSQGARGPGSAPWRAPRGRWRAPLEGGRGVWGP